MGFVLTHGPAPDEDVALEALHGAADRHDHRVDLHRNLACRSQDKNLQEEGRLWRLDVNNHLRLIKDGQVFGVCVKGGGGGVVRPLG